MAGIVHLVVGRRKSGKTFFSKNLLKNAPVFCPKIIYDVNNEYKEFYPYEFEPFDDFLNKCVEAKNSYILFEEATIFFDSRKTSEEMKNLLVRARHTNNIIQINFHSFSTIPKYIKNLIDYITIFKTGDTLKDVKDKFDNIKIINAFNLVNKSNNEHEHITISLY